MIWCADGDQDIEQDISSGWCSWVSGYGILREQATHPVSLPLIWFVSRTMDY